MIKRKEEFQFSFKKEKSFFEWRIFFGGGEEPFFKILKLVINLPWLKVQKDKQISPTVSAILDYSTHRHIEGWTDRHNVSFT